MKKAKPTVKSLTREDLIEILKDFPTKKDLHNEISHAEVRLETNIDFKIMESERRTDEKAQKYRDQILTREDKTIGELSDIREVNVFQDNDIHELKVNFENHEKRIVSLEDSSKHTKN